jgi:hypothetical protein
MVGARSVVRAYRPDTYHIIQEVEKVQRKRPRKKAEAGAARPCTCPPPLPAAVHCFLNNWAHAGGVARTPDLGYSYSEESGGTAEAIAYGTFGKKHL